MDDLSENLNKLQIEYLYASTIENHMTYDDDICICSPSVSGLMKFTDFCAEYGSMFDITHNANKAYCMFIDNTPQDENNIYPVAINNHILPHTDKYRVDIINNNLTDDDDIVRQKKL